MKWQNWKTRTKLLFGFGLLVTLTIGISIFGIGNNLLNETKTFIITKLQDTETYFLIGRLNTRAYIDLKDTSYYNNATSSLNNCKNIFKELKTKFTIAENIKLAVEFDTLLEIYYSHVQNMHELIEKQNITAKKRRDTRNEFIKGFENAKLTRDNNINYYFNEGRLNAVYLLSVIKEEYYNNALSSLNKSIEEAVQQKKPDLQALLINYKNSIDDYYNLGIDLKNIEANMKIKGGRMTKILDDISENTLTYLNTSNKAANINFIVVTLIILLFSTVIIYYITTYFTKMLGRGVKLTETFASGNLTYKISDEDLKLRDEMGDLNRALSAMGNKLNVIVSDIVNGAIAVASAGQQINSTTLQLSHGANEQASTVEEVSSSMEQMVSSIQMNADNALQTEKIAQITVEEVRNLSEISEKSLESVRKISGKIGIINDIAFQTNILALNAAVEAARAGENGKGFAVVASEVRKLAELSKSAANEIMLLSQGSLNNTEAAVAQMLHLIPEIEKIAQLIREMAASNKEQSSGSDLINSAIQQLNTITQQNAAASEELASGVDGLSNQADHLRDVVAFFKIDESKKV